jgi:hypothetical protein
MVLRYQIAEENRFLFQNWEYMQILLGVFFFSYMLFGTLEGKFPLGLALLMVILTGVQRFGISPELGTVGKTLDYVSADALSAERARFWLLHSAYLGCEALKYGIGLCCWRRCCGAAARWTRSTSSIWWISPSIGMSIGELGHATVLFT